MATAYELSDRIGKVNFKTTSKIVVHTESVLNKSLFKLKPHNRVRALIRFERHHVIDSKFDLVVLCDELNNLEADFNFVRNALNESGIVRLTNPDMAMDVYADGAEIMLVGMLWIEKFNLKKSLRDLVPGLQLIIDRRYNDRLARSLDD